MQDFFIIFVHLSSSTMAYSLPLQAYICQKGIRNVFPSSTSRLLPGIESALPPIQSINSSPSSVLLTPLESGQIESFPTMHQILADNQTVYAAAYSTTQHDPRSQVRNDVIASSSLPFPAVEYFGKSLPCTLGYVVVLMLSVVAVHVAWDVINGKTELSPQSALHLTIHPPTPPPQAPVLQPEPAFRDYIHRLIATTAVSQSVVVIALLYLYRARSALQRQLVIGDVIDRRQGYSMCAASLMLGNKYLDDNTYTSRTWATLSGYSLWEINDCEKRLLQALDFQLNISLQEYNDWLRLLALYTPVPAKEIKLTGIALSEPLIAESRAPLMPVTRRRISRIEMSRPASRKRSHAEPEVANVSKRVMLSTHQQPLATSQVVTYQDHPCMYTQPPAYSVPPPQMYPFAIDNSFAIQVSLTIRLYIVQCLTTLLYCLIRIIRLNTTNLLRRLRILV